MWGKENRENLEGKKKWRKIKNRFKINKLFLYVTLNLIHLVQFFHTKIK